jgi:hypothetical protein
MTRVKTSNARVVKSARAKSGKEKRLEAKAAKPSAPLAMVPADAVKKAAMKITDAALARLARGTRTMMRQAKAADISCFSPYKPPKGVVPKTWKPRKLAMDSAGWGAMNPNAYATSGLFSQGWTFMGYATLSELTQIPEYRTASEIISTECTRKWIEFQAAGDLEKDEDEEVAEKIKKLEEAVKRSRLKACAAKMVLDDGFFGRSHLYVDNGKTDDEDELEKPIGNGRDDLSVAKVKKGKLRPFKVVEPIWTYPSDYDSRDPLSDDWYNPSTWFVMGKLVHSSRLLKLVSRPVPDVLKPAYAFGGLSLSQMGKPYIDNWLRTRQSVADIVHSFSVMVLLTDLSTSLQADGDQLYKRLEIFTTLRDNNGVFAANKDTELFENVSAPLGTLDSLQAQTQEHMSAVFRTPLVKLLGITPAGLNASSDGEIRVWEDTVAAYQEANLRPILETAIDFVQLSEFGAVDDRIKWRFVPLHTMTEEEESTVQKNKADTHKSYVDMGAISPEEVRRSLATDDESLYAGLDVDDVPDPMEDLEPENVHENAAPPEEGAKATKPAKLGKADK